MQRRKHAIVLTCTGILILTILLPACGGDDDVDDDTPTSTSTSEPTATQGSGAQETASAPSESTATATATELPAGETPPPTAAPGDTPTPTQIVETGIDVEAGCAITRALGGSDPAVLSELLACESPVEDWTLIRAGGSVTTDPSGQAWLDFADRAIGEKCGRVYVFHDGELQRSPDLPGGLQIKSGTALWRNECSGLITVETPSANVTLQGTSIIVSYLPTEDREDPRDMTFVAILDGWVEATPLIEMNSDVSGSMAVVEQQQFWFSTPGEEPDDVAGLDAREPHSFSELPGFIDAMGIESWMATAIDAAVSEGIPTGEMPRPEVAQLRGAGGALNERAIQNGLIEAINEDEWQTQVDVLFPDRQGTMVTLIGDQAPINVQRLPFDDDPILPALDNLSITLLISATDGTSIEWARHFREALARTGVLLDVEEVPPGDALNRFNELAASRPTLWLERIPEPPPTEPEPDTSPAAILTLGHTPDEPTTRDSVTIEVLANDPESGVASIQIRMFEELIQACETDTCEVTLGQLPVGTYTYQVIVTNGYGLAEPPFERTFDVVADPGCDDFDSGVQVEVMTPGGEGVNIREDPSTTAEIITVALDGTRFTIVDGPWSGDGFSWWRVTGDDGVGFIIQDYLTTCINDVE